MAPIRAVAYWTSTHSAQFGLQIPTRSPFSMPGREEGAGQVVDRSVELRVRQAHVLERDDERLVVGEAGHRRREVLADGLADEGHRGRAVRVGLDHLGHR